jgi:voltage-gated potassium channel
MIPLVVFGMLETQPLLGATVRGLRLIRLFRLLQLFSRTIRVFAGSNSKLLYMILFSSMAIIAGALSMFFIESNVKDSKITNIGDAFWWAIATVTTVGYGDVYPVTIEGRNIAAFFMLLGIAIIGVVISTLGATIIEKRLYKSQSCKGQRQSGDKRKN